MPSTCKENFVTCGPPLAVEADTTDRAGLPGDDRRASGGDCCPSTLAAAANTLLGEMLNANELIDALSSKL